MVPGLNLVSPLSRAKERKPCDMGGKYIAFPNIYWVEVKIPIFERYMYFHHV